MTARKKDHPGEPTKNGNAGSFAASVPDEATDVDLTAPRNNTLHIDGIGDVEMVPIPWQAEEFRDRASRRNPEYDERCLFCVGPIKDPQKASWVHMATSGELFPVALDLDEDPNSQGWFAIGPECAKKIPSTHRSQH